MIPSASDPLWSLAFTPRMSSAKIDRCASPFAYCPVYTAPTPMGKNPARMPATVGFGPLPPAGGTVRGGGIRPDCEDADAPGLHPVSVPVVTPSILAPRQSSQ